MAIQQNFPDEGPTLNLNFAGSRTLDPRITFTRTSSATHMGPDGVIKIAAANSPRFDHSYNSATGEIESLGLLVEEARTNLLLRSEDFMNVWTLFQSSRIENTSIAPDNQLTADSLIPDVGATNGLIRQNISGLLDNTTYTFSVFLKFAGLSNISLQFFNKSDTFHGSKVLNLSNGLLSGTGFIGETSVVSYPNDWYRLIFTNLGSGTGAATPNVRVVCLSTGDGTSGLFLWGAQLEQGSFPTSYIPTTASTVTRTADNASMTGSNFSSWYRQDEGTLVTEVTTATTATIGADWIRMIGGASVNINSIRLGRSGSGATPQLLVRKNDVSQASPFTTGVQPNIFSKLGFYYKTNDFGITRNGAALTGFAISTTGEVPTLDRMLISNPSVNGHIKNITYYPTRLPNNILQNLTR